MIHTFLDIVQVNIRRFPITCSYAWFQLQKENKNTDLGWFWAIAKPIFYMLMFYVAITLGFRQAKNIEGMDCPYFVWLAAGLCAWFYLQSQIMGGANSFRRYRGLYKNSSFPTETIPMIVVVKAFFIHLILLCILMVFVMFNGVRPSVYWLQLPIYMILMLCFCFLWGFVGGLLGLLSGDFLSLMRSIQPAFFWLSGIFFNSRTRVRLFFHLNPITFIVEGYRNCFCFKQWIWEEPDRIKYFAIELLVLFVSALLLYKRLKPSLYEIA